MEDGDDVEVDSILFRPAVIYNENTGKYVMWVNRIPRGESVLRGYLRGTYIVGSSDSPSGPFTILDSHPDLAHKGGADFALFAEGGKAYVAYGSWYLTDAKDTLLEHPMLCGDACVDGHAIAIQELSDDFLNTKEGGEAKQLTPSHNEAPTMFKRGEYYYLIYGTLCCFCQQGGDANVKVALDPMGNWTWVNNINPHGKSDRRVPAQNSGIIKVRTTNFTGADIDDVYVCTGDLWQSSIKGTKAAENVHREVLEFHDEEVMIDGEMRVVPVPQRLQNSRQVIIKDVPPIITKCFLEIN